MDALYFPNLSLPATTWVNPALLYFDRVAVIAPFEDRDTLFDDRTRRLIDLDMVRPVVPNGIWGSEQDDQFVAFILGGVARGPSSDKFGRMHGGKIAYTPAIRKLIEAGLLQEADERWLEGAAWVVDSVMSYLATQTSLHAHERLPLVTDNLNAAQTLVGRGPVNDVSRRVQAVCRLLKVPPRARPEKLAKFRDRHRRELESFRRFIDELISRDQYRDADMTFESRLDEAERVRTHLSGELEVFNWREVGPAIVISAAATAASLAEGGHWSAGVGLLGLLYSGSEALRQLERHGRARRDPLAYATSVINEWHPTAEHALI